MVSSLFWFDNCNSFCHYLDWNYKGSTSLKTRSAILSFLDAVLFEKALWLLCRYLCQTCPLVENRDSILHTPLNRVFAYKIMLLLFVSKCFVSVRHHKKSRLYLNEFLFYFFQHSWLEPMVSQTLVKRYDCSFTFPRADFTQNMDMQR